MGHTLVFARKIKGKGIDDNFKFLSAHHCLKVERAAFRT